METCLVNLRWKPWEADHEDLVYVGRYNRWAKLPQSKWHNPFKIAKGDDTPAKRRDILEDYRAYLLGREDLVLALPELRGKILCCWCVDRTIGESDVFDRIAPGVCHGEVLIAELIRLYGMTPLEWP